MDPNKLQIYGGIDEEEAVAVPREAASHFRKVVAKAIGGVLLYRKVNPIIAYASYSTVGSDDDHYHGVFPKKEPYQGRDRDEAIAVARVLLGS